MVGNYREIATIRIDGKKKTSYPFSEVTLIDTDIKNKTKYIKNNIMKNSS